MMEYKQWCRYMGSRSKAMIFALCFPLVALAQQEESSQPQELQTLPEEVVIMGDRSLTQMRLQLLEAEKNAYDIFNKFNDEMRFTISCSMHQPTGTRFETQVCQPEFQIAATRTHAQHYLENTRDMLNQFAAGIPVPVERTPPVYIPVEAVIAAQQEDYRLKFRQVAEEHPEFLDAIIQYSEMREQYEAATAPTGE